MIERYVKRISQHTAVYWSTPSARADGSNSYAAPVEIDCFWKNENKMMATKDGKEVFVVATIYVSQDLDEQGMLFLGTLDDLTTTQKNDPRRIARAYEINQFIKTPSLHLKGKYNRVAMITPRRGRAL